MKLLKVVATGTAIGILLNGVWAGPKETAPSNIKEVTVELSKDAQKGTMVGVTRLESGGFEVVYALRGKKKEDKISYEVYPFGEELTPKSAYRSEENRVRDTAFAPETLSTIMAMVGGTTSFTALSMKLKLIKQSRVRTWNPAKARVDVKYLGQTDIKPKSAEDEGYDAYMDVYSPVTGEIAVLACYEAGGESDNLRHVVLFFDKDANKKVIPLTFDFPQSLVYATLVPRSDSAIVAGDRNFDNCDLGMFFAPKEDAKNVKQMTFIRMDNTGALIDRFVFDRPGGPMAIVGECVKGGSLYVLGMSIADENQPIAFEEEFNQFAHIYSPAAGSGGMGYWEMNYYSKLKDVEYVSINPFKITKGKIDFMGNTPVKDLKKIAKAAPGSGKPVVYEGGNVSIGEMSVLGNGQIAVSLNSVNFSVMNAYSNWEYTGYYYLQFSAAGSVTSQYGFKRLNDDKEDIVFTPVQFFDPPQNSVAPWSMLEPKGFEGYETVMDAVNGRKTVYPRYVPRIARVNQSSGSLESSHIPGGGGYFLYPNKYTMVSVDGASRLFFGSDEDGKKLWVGKVGLK